MAPPRTMVILCAAVVVSGAALCDAAHAQFGTQYDPRYWIPLRELGNPLSGTVIGRTVTGRLNESPDLDIVFLRDGRPEMYVDPRITSGTLAYPSGVTTPDIAVLPAAGSGLDELLTIDSGGLKAWVRDSGLTGGFGSRYVGSASTWISVERIRTAALSGGSRVDVVGYRDSDQKIVMVIDPDEAGETESSFAVVRPALEIVPFVRDSSGTVNIAIRCAIGVVIYDLAGNYQTHFPGPGAGALVALDQQGTSYQRLAWFHPDSGDNVLDLITNQNGTLGLIGTSVALGSGSNVVAAIATDWDGAAGQDLIVSHQGSFQLVVLLDQGGTYALGAGAVQHLFAGTPGDDASANEAVPVATDIDNDADADVLFANNDSANLYVFLNDTVAHDDRVPFVEPVLWYDIDAVEHAWIELDLASSTAIVVPNDANAIEIGLWRQAVPGVAGSTQFLERQLHYLSSAGVTELELDVADKDGELEEIYFWLIRYVELADPGVDDSVVQTFPPSVRGLTTAAPDAAGPALAYLESLPGHRETREISTLGYEIIFGIPQLTDGADDTDSSDTETDPIPELPPDDDPTGPGGFGG